MGHELDVTARKTSSFGRSRGHSAVGCHPNGAGRATDELTLKYSSGVRSTRSTVSNATLC